MQNLEQWVQQRQVLLSDLLKQKAGNYSYEQIKAYSDSLIKQGISVNFQAQFKISHELLGKCLISAIRVSVKVSSLCEGAKDVCFQTLTIQTFAASDFVQFRLGEQPPPEATKDNLSSSSMLLRSLLLDPHSYDRFVKGLVLLINRSDVAYEKKKNILKLLIKLMNFDYQFSLLIYQELDLRGFITFYVQRAKASNLEINQFLKHFINCPHFQSNLYIVLVEVIPLMVTGLVVTPIGLKLILKLFKWCYQVDRDLSSFTLLYELNNLTLKIKSIRNPYYSLLRNQHKISSLSFEVSIFQKEFHNSSLNQLRLKNKR